MHITDDIRTRFWSKVSKRGDDECWPWTGSAVPAGYGKMQFRKRGEFIYSHRLSLLISGRNPEPKQVALHICNNPCCVNPAHLQWGTQKENMAQAIKQGRAPHKGRVAGERNGNVKLTNEDVVAIRQSAMSRRELAATYGVTPSLISAIALGRAWSHV